MTANYFIAKQLSTDDSILHYYKQLSTEDSKLHNCKQLSKQITLLQTAIY